MKLWVERKHEETYSPTLFKKLQIEIHETYLEVCSNNVHETLWFNGKENLVLHSGI
jgi:hypothetical protein